VPSLRALLRQRTRWSQGNLQAFTLTGDVVRAPVPLGARVELLAYLLMPLWQGIIGVTFLAAVALTGLRVAPFWGGGPAWQLAVFYAFAFGGTILGCVAGRRSTGMRAWVTGFLIGNVYALYTWLLWPVLARSVLRQLTHRHTWSKTEREPIETARNESGLTASGYSSLSPPPSDRE
jgi:uncharacterized membrane protein